MKPPANELRQGLVCCQLPFLSRPIPGGERKEWAATCLEETVLRRFGRTVEGALLHETSTDGSDAAEGCLYGLAGLDFEHTDDGATEYDIVRA
jgi:hypothetical protein